MLIIRQLSFFNFSRTGKGLINFRATIIYHITTSANFSIQIIRNIDICITAAACACVCCITCQSKGMDCTTPRNVGGKFPCKTICKTNIATSGNVNRNFMNVNSRNINITTGAVSGAKLR